MLDTPAVAVPAGEYTTGVIVRGLGACVEVEGIDSMFLYGRLSEDPDLEMKWRWLLRRDFAIALTSNGPRRIDQDLGWIDLPKSKDADPFANPDREALLCQQDLPADTEAVLVLTEYTRKEGPDKVEAKVLFVGTQGGGAGAGRSLEREYTETIAESGEKEDEQCA